MAWVEALKVWRGALSPSFSGRGRTPLPIREREIVEKVAKNTVKLRSFEEMTIFDEYSRRRSDPDFCDKRGGGIGYSRSQICSQSWFVYRDDRLEDFAKNEVSLWQVGEHLKYQCQTILKTSPSKSVRNLVNNADFNCNYQNSKLESNATKALNML